jgi:hypothetical protein
MGYFKELDSALRCQCETKAQLERERLRVRMEGQRGNWLYAIHEARRLPATATMAKAEAQKTVDWWKRQYEEARAEYEAWEV